MPSGLGLSLTTFSPGTTIASSASNSNFAAINAGAIANDAGSIVTNGGGVITAPGITTQVLQSNPSPVTINGTTAGTAAIYQVFQGVFKLFVLVFNGYQNNSGTEQTIGLPTPFTAKGFCIAGNTKVITPYKSGSALVNNVRQITALAAGGGSTSIQNSITAEGLASITGPFDAVGLGTGQVSTSNDIAVFFGI